MTLKSKKQGAVEPPSGVALGQRIRLYPTDEQAVAFAKACGVARATWNWGLVEWKRQYEEWKQQDAVWRTQGGVGKCPTIEKPTAYSLKKQYNSIKKEKFPYVYESPKDANQQPFANLHSAFQSFFKGEAEYPQLKRKKDCKDSFYLSNDQFRFEDGYVKLPLIGRVKLAEYLRSEFQGGKILSGTVSEEAGQWFLSVNIQLNGDQKTAYLKERPRLGEGIVGVDLGVKTAVALSNGTMLEGPKAFKQFKKKLRRQQRVTARRARPRLDAAAKVKAERKAQGLPSLLSKERPPQGKNEQKSRKAVARTHQKIANIRRDFLHKTTASICRENQMVVIEDLNVKGMLKNHRLARSISDMGFHEFKRQMLYKADLYGVQLVIADRWFPSSKTCSRCKHKKANLALKERIFRCASCGLVIDRDLNAALNLRDYPIGRELGKISTKSATQGYWVSNAHSHVGSAARAAVRVSLRKRKAATSVESPQVSNPVERSEKFSGDHQRSPKA